MYKMKVTGKCVLLVFLLTMVFAAAESSAVTVISTGFETAEGWTVGPVDAGENSPGGLSGNWDSNDFQEAYIQSNSAMAYTGDGYLEMDRMAGASKYYAVLDVSSWAEPYYQITFYLMSGDYMGMVKSDSALVTFSNRAYNSGPPWNSGGHRLLTILFSGSGNGLVLWDPNTGYADTPRYIDSRIQVGSYDKYRIVINEITKTSSVYVDPNNTGNEVVVAEGYPFTNTDDPNDPNDTPVLRAIFFEAASETTRFYVDDITVEAIPYGGEECGDGFSKYLAGDLNKDCKVDMKDVSEFVQQWLQCTDPIDVSCDPYWWD